MSENRIEWIDRWRGLLILAIVLFHVVGIGVKYSVGVQRDFFAAVAQCIASFHVVSFFAIVGLLWRDQGQPFVAFIRTRACRVLVPYFVWGIGMIAMNLLAQTAGAGNDSLQAYGDISTRWWQPFLSLLWGNPDRVIGPLWFLPNVFLVGVACLGAFKIVRTKRAALLAAGICYVIEEILRPYYLNLPWGLALLPDYLVYVFLARVLVPLHEPAFFSGRRWLWAVIGGGLLAVSWIVPFWYWASALLPSPRFPMIVRCTLGLCGSAFLVRSFDSAFLAFVGRSTIGILVMHKFVIVAFQAVSPLMRFAFRGGCGSAILMTGMITICAVAIPLACTIFIRRFAPWMIGEVKIRKGMINE